MNFAITGPDLWLWFHIVQIAVFGATGIWLFLRLAGEPERQPETLRRLDGVKA
jgi:hypothetical protein